ncbi:MAG: PIN domain-containing protein [Nitrospirae bacterium]|nr:PIN domain-containing protein [Nitrospirota bacterium]
MGQIISVGQVPAGTSIFIDANIFIYHFIYETAESQSCTSLLKRVENGDIKGLTSTIVLAEISHRLMVFEAIEKYELNSKNAVRFLKEHPGKVKSLNKHFAAVNEVKEMDIHLMTVESQDIFASQMLQKKYGFLTNDSINLHLMLRDSIFNLASNDPDFEKVDLITLYKPF